MPKWLEDAVFYEIYPQSFNDTNGDGVGDLKGITEKLDYIKSIGCTDIWINPCFDSPFGDAGYDVRDYYKIAPRYGSNDDAKILFEEAHKRGMHVLLDLVPGHTSVECDWFTESKKSEKNKYTDRYIWTDSIWKLPDGQGYLSGISDRDGCALINFFSCQPALNYGYAVQEESYQMKPEDEAPMATREAMKDVMKFWLDLGCDGFRVDMAFSLVKKDADGSANIKLWQDVFSYFKKNYPEAAFVSEWGEPAKAIAGGFDMDFLLHFGPSGYLSLCRADEPYFSRDGKGDVTEFLKNYQHYYDSVKGSGYIAFPTGNHDMARATARCDEDMVKLYFTFLFTMPSVPFLYYGDEIGMKYLKGISSVEGGYDRTGARSPMQWSDEKNAGFSDCDEKDLYIMIDPDFDRPNVKAQDGKESSMLTFTREIIALRKKYKSLGAKGEYTYIHTGKYPLTYRRYTDDESMIVIVNPDEKAYDIDIATGDEVVFAYGKGAAIKSGRVHIEGASAVIVKER